METTKRLVTYDPARFIRDPGWIRTNDTRFRSEPSGSFAGVDNSVSPCQPKLSPLSPLMSLATFGAHAG